MMTSDSAKRFLNVREAAIYLGFSEDTIRSWVKKGIIPRSKISRGVRFDLLKLELWLKEKEVPIFKADLP